MAGGKKKLGWRGSLMLTVLFFTAVVFAPTTVLLLIGMLPTIVAGFTDMNPERTRGITVGALNLAACSPFVMDMWRSGEHSLARTGEVLSDPYAIIIMWMGAAAGYMLEWSLTEIVSVFLSQKAKNRIKEINKSQEALKERWGEEVTDEMPLDERGFRIVREEPAREHG